MNSVEADSVFSTQFDATELDVVEHSELTESQSSTPKQSTIPDPNDSLVAVSTVQCTRA